MESFDRRRLFPRIERAVIRQPLASLLILQHPSRALARASGPNAKAQYRALICASTASSFGVSFRRDRRLRHRYSIFSLSDAACFAL
jgi:hypothetical protein